MLESMIGLTVVLQAYHLEAIDEHVPLSQGITLRAMGPARCRLTAR